MSIPSDFQCKDLIAQTMELFRSNNFYPLPNMNYALSNLISVLALANDGDLFNYDFSYLDLRNCTLANYNFHHFDGGSNSSFRGANIGLDTFSTNAHEGNVLKWALSDDGQFIISISSTLELKVWNISTQKCIITRQCPDLDNVVSIGTLELREQGSLALITYKDYSATVDTYEIDQNDVLTHYCVVHIPCPWQIIPKCHLMYTILNSSGLAIIKAIKPSEDTYMVYREYKYTTPNESYFRMYFESDNTYELLDHWTLASLGNSQAPFGLQAVEDGNVQVDEKFFASNDDNLICVGDSYYEHRMSSHKCIPLDSKLFTSVDRLNYSRKKRSIYYNDRQSSSIHRYNIDAHRTAETSNYLHPHILVYGCDFSRCEGYLDRLPWYMIKRH